MASSNQEVEIKFRIADIQALTGALQSAGFHLLTARTHEMNALFDLPGQVLRGRGQLLRLREYGEKWILTFKDKGSTQSRHKSRPEIETPVENGPAVMQILESLGYERTF